VGERIEGRLATDVVLLVEHPPVFTLGRRGGMENLTVSEAFLAARGIEVVPTGRGGNITYHGPGQLVAYPIVALIQAGISVKAFVFGLESAMIRTARQWGIPADRDERNRGAWVGPDKLGSIGITLRRGVSFHGLALNVNTDLEPFGWINPCGLTGVRVTSMARAAGRPMAMDNVSDALIRHMGEVFEVRMEELPREALGRTG
jgi:lipoate-protein ligase B